MHDSSTVLFEPIQVGDTRLNNRIVMAPMTRSRAELDGTPPEIMATYYAQRASAGMVITEATYVSPVGKGYPGVPGIVSRRHMAGWKRVVDAVHKEGGKIALQIWHSGRVGHSSVIGHGEIPVAPSPISPEGMTATLEGFVPYETPHELQGDEIPIIIEQHVRAAKLAMEVGFDAVELHAANGYLLDQFLRDGSNKRKDEYGGAVENRARLTLDTLRAVADAIGPGRVGLRLSPFNLAFSMFDSDPWSTFSHVVSEANELGIAFMHLTRMGVEHAGDLAFDIESLAALFDGPTLLNGGYDKDSGAAAIAAGHGDFIAYGMPFTSNPDLVKRYKTGAALTPPDPNALYSGGESGYVDFVPCSPPEAHTTPSIQAKPDTDYDIVISGGGLAGSSLAIALSGTDLKVLVVETTQEFEDRVRGEAVMPWGVDEMEKLGIDKLLLDNCAVEVPQFRMMYHGMIMETRDLPATTPGGRGVLCYKHVDMQNTLLGVAQNNGTAVWRNSKVVDLTRVQQDPNAFTDNDYVKVSILKGGETVEVTTRILVAADGRSSSTVKSAGFELKATKNGTLISGMLVKNFHGPAKASQHAMVPDKGLTALSFPLDEKGEFTRIYLCAHNKSETKLMNGEKHIDKFVEASIASGMNPACFSKMEPAGPLATYVGTHSWLEHPYRDGVVALGDAGSTVDPAFGLGQSLTSREVRLLRDELLTAKSLVKACDDFATQAHDYYMRLKRLEEWYRDLQFNVSDEARAFREKAGPLHMMDPSRMPDLMGLGGDAPSDEVARMRFYGEV